MERSVSIVYSNYNLPMSSSFYNDLSQLWRGIRGQRQATNNDDDDNNDVNHRNPRVLWLVELRRVIMAYLVLLTLALSLLVAYRWQTKGYYEAEYERRLEAAARQKIILSNATTTGSKIPSSSSSSQSWWTTQGELFKESLSSIRDLGRLQDQALRNMTKQQATLMELRQQLEGLDFDALTRKGDKEPVPVGGSLTSLLQKSSLDEVPSMTVLNHLFERAIIDLKNALEAPEHRDFGTLQSQLSSEEFPPKQASVAGDGVVLQCPEVGEDNAAISNIPENVARQSDLDREAARLRKILTRRSKLNTGFRNLVLPETFAHIDRTARQEIQETLESIVATATAVQEQQQQQEQQQRMTSSSTTGSCLTKEQVLELVEEGLLALQRHADLRNVLRKKVLELDPKAQSIILDADLPLPRPKLPIRETTNLRRVLDTPLILQLAHGIDQLVEWSGGYNDRFDHWLDSMAGERESVGEMVVRQLLEKSAKVEIPHADKMANDYLPKQAQELLKKSKII